MKKVILVLVLSTSLGNAVLSNAQIQRSKVGAGVLLGGSQLRGDIDKVNTDLTGGLIFRLRPLPFFSLTATSSYGQMTSGLNAFKTKVINSSLSGNLFVFLSRKLSPFLTVGLSGLHFATKDGDGHQILRFDGSPVSGWETAVQVGIGMEFLVKEQWAINTTVDYYFTHGDELDAIDQGKNDGFFQGLIGILHYFKKHKKIKKEEVKYPKSLHNPMQNADVEKSLEPRRPMTSEDLNQNLERVTTVPIETTHSFEEEDNTNTLASRRQNPEAIKNEEEVAEGIYFEAGSARILKKSADRLRKIYQYLLENPEDEIELQLLKKSEYHSKEDKILAYMRAKAIKTYLVNLGIKPTRILINTEP